MLKHNRFAAAMRAVDPSITLIGSGAMPDQLQPREAKENASLESIQHKFGTDEDWTGGLLREAWGNFGGIREHWHDRAEQRPAEPQAADMIEFAHDTTQQGRVKGEAGEIHHKNLK